MTHAAPSGPGLSGTECSKTTRNGVKILMSDLKPEKRSDRLVLSALLTSGKLTSGEERAFRSMLESLDSGQVRLTPPQRMWVDQIYDKLRLDQQAFPNKAVKSKTAAAMERLNEHPLDRMMKTRPLKPPGRS